MGIEYINRCDEKYYLLQGKTKTGKPKYYVSRNPEGLAVEQMPEGYEFYEHPKRGLVSFRKTRPTNIQPNEREQLEAWTRQLSGAEQFIIEIKDNGLIVYTPSNNPDAVTRLMDDFFGGFPAHKAEARGWLVKSMNFTAMLRFTLVDEEKRLFSVERWCFKGSIDNWFFLASGRPLEEQARKFLPHICQESFFNLM